MKSVKNIRYVVWGIGVRGKYVTKNIKSSIVAIIEKDSSKVGQYYLDIPIISIEEYEQKYSDTYIIVSPRFFEEIVFELKERKIDRYFILYECPFELQEPVNRKTWEQMTFDIPKEKHFFIFGLTLTSLLLCSYYKDIGKEITIIANSKCNSKLVEKIKEDFDDISVIDSFDNISNSDLIMTVIPDVRYEFKQLPFWVESIMPSYAEQCFINSHENKRDFYDLTDMNRVNFGGNLSEFNGIHSGKRCFIIGNGPSLKMADLDILRQNGEICFGVNGIFHAFEKTEWRPDYYVVADSQIYKIYPKEIKCFNVKNKFFCLPQGDDPYPLDLIDDTVRFYNYRFGIKFSSDIDRAIYDDKGTSLFVCMQIAAYMGFNEIILLGVDFDYSSSKDKITSYFSEDYTKKREKMGLVSVENIEKSFNYENSMFEYQVAKDYGIKNGITILNATRGGKLEVFTRVDFDHLFEV